uniref:Si:dkey-238d18.6 n=1 Tax=Xiphophorus couchianus TaxID=32473 RepID=A0A3B5L3H6_9TELE
SIETERAAVKGFYIINLQRAVSFIQVSHNFGPILEVVQNVTAGIVVHHAPSFFVPDATSQMLILVVLETAGDDHTGPSQGTESDRDKT